MQRDDDDGSFEEMDESVAEQAERRAKVLLHLYHHTFAYHQIFINLQISNDESVAEQAERRAKVQFTCSILYHHYTFACPQIFNKVYHRYILYQQIFISKCKCL